MKKEDESISIIIPAYQEAGTIESVIKGLQAVCAQLPYESEIIVVSDGSTDGTAEIAERTGAHVLRHPYNKGYGASLKTGIRAATGRTIVSIDADGQHDPKDLLRIMEERKQFDLVVGARKGTAGSPLWRKPGKVFLRWLANYLAKRKIPDLNSGYRAMDREMIVRFLSLMPEGFSFVTTSTLAAFQEGYSVQYVPIEVKTRQAGKSSVNLKDGFATIMLIIRIMTLFSPLRVFLPVSFVTFMVGSFFMIQSYLTVGQSSIRGLIALLAAVQFFLFGVLVDQVSALRRGERIK